MSIDLYPTPSRLALLRHVAAGKVRHYLGRGRSGGDGVSVDQVADRRCTAEIAAMRRAGWVDLRPLRSGDGASQKWELTTAGRALLDEPDRTHRPDEAGHRPTPATR